MEIQIQNLYNNWKLHPFIKEMPKEIIVTKTTDWIMGLNMFYGLVGLSADDISVIHQYVQKYCTTFPMLKLADLDRAIEVHKERPTLNKLCPEYFETIFEKYRRGKERAEIFRLWVNDPEQHKDEIPENTKTEYTATELLEICYNNWKLTKEINLNTGRVYEENFNLLKSKLGLSLMSDIKEKLKAELINKFESGLRYLRPGAVRDEYEKQLNQIREGGGLLKTETRKAHLKEYFQSLNKPE